MLFEIHHLSFFWFIFTHFYKTLLLMYFRPPRPYDAFSSNTFVLAILILVTISPPAPSDSRDPKKIIAHY